MKMLKVLLNNLREGPSTDPFPFGETFSPEGLRARVEFNESACTGCRMCEHVCSAGAIRFHDTDEGMSFTLWHNSCMYCGLCEYYCKPKAIRLSEDWHLAHRQEDKYTLIETGTVHLEECEHCNTTFIPTSPELIDVAYKEASPMIEKLGRICPDCRRTYTAELLLKGSLL